MYGRPRGDAGAQLALMDAMVFFAVCAMICATLVSSAVPQSGGGWADGPAPPDADGLLAVFLAASIGGGAISECTGLELTGAETFGEALFMVSAIVADGCPAELFSPLLNRSWEVLYALSSPWSPALRLWASHDGSWAPIAEVGVLPDSSASVYSASQSLGSSECVSLMVTVLLFPALVLHDLGV